MRPRLDLRLVVGVATWLGSGCRRGPGRECEASCAEAGVVTGGRDLPGFVMDDVRARVFAPVLRGLERVLPVPAYFALLYPAALIRALIHTAAKGRPPAAWPSCLELPAGWSPSYLHRLPVYLNRTFEFFPDRLSGPKWQGCCRSVGLEPVRRAVSEGKPVILVSAHFGPMVLQRSWLRAAGLPVALLVAGISRRRSALLRRKDRWALFPEVPTAFHLDELSAAIRHLHAGRPLAMAMDVSTGRQMQVPLGDGGYFEMATGPFRLARRHRATIFGCAIYNEGPWRFVLEATPSVPEAILESGDEAAGADLLGKLLPVLRAHPDHWTPQLAGRFRLNLGGTSGS